MLVGGSVADKAARQVHPGEAIELVGSPPRFVGRGGDKLEAALGRFAVIVAGREALDAGASTGGFTDCLLQHGARSVVAVDVGHGQLHERLRADARVASHERQDIRTFAHDPFALVVADLSFISLRSVAPHLAGRLAGPGADLVVLVKPQFEVGRAVAARGRGVVRDAAEWQKALEGVHSAMTAEGAAMMDAMVSPLKGADGNVEFLLHFVAHTTAPEVAADFVALTSQAAGGA